MASDWDVCQSDYRYLFQPSLLKGKVAFVTGGGSGIGFTITEMLMRHGCNVAIASRNIQRVQESAKKLEAGTGMKCLALQMDVRKPVNVITAVDEILKEYGKIDILVNNAAGNFICPLSGLSYNAFKTVMEIDTMGTFNVSKTVYDKCMKNTGGVIVNISATLQNKATIFQAHASTAKAAIDNLTRHMAVEWGPQKIRVVGVAPGPIAETEGVRRLGGLTGSAEEYRNVPDIPLGALGTKLEIAHAVVFVASEIASSITGHTLISDGGAWMTQPNSFEMAASRLNLARTAKL